MTASARQRSEGTPHLPKPTTPATLRSRTAAVASKPSPDQGSGGGGRNARATSRVSAFLEIPRRFTLANHRLPLALPQSSGKLRTLTFSLHSLSGTTLRPATQNKSAAVQNLWTTGLPCGRRRKTKKNLRTRLLPNSDKPTNRKRRTTLLHRKRKTKAAPRKQQQTPLHLSRSTSGLRHLYSGVSA